MTQIDLTKLDNPLWNALTGVQRSFAIGAGSVRRYRPGILPFAAYDHDAPENIIDLDGLFREDAIFFIVGKLPPLPPQWELVRELPCAQMILRTPSSLPVAATAITPLTAADRDTMYGLISKVQPGYYEPDTHQLGNYYGIWQDGKLVSIAGERMQIEGMTEISAVCTDAACTGRGYAQQLVAHVSRINIEKGNIPFLHVLLSNERAIRVYELLGFEKRRDINFWKLKKGL